MNVAQHIEDDVTLQYQKSGEPCSKHLKPTPVNFFYFFVGFFLLSVSIILCDSGNTCDWD